MSQETVFALLDGNNFYVSAERHFDPRLTGRPVVVLSNNDGSAISRSDEAKALGIKMGDPWFRIRHLEQSKGLIALSSNFVLYGDMSARMMEIAESLGSELETYSIDECFLSVGGIRDITQHAFATRERILRWIGIPTCIGIGPSKTLAKLGNYIAKSAERKPGSYPPQLAQVCNLVELTERQREWLLKRTAVTEVWGVGPRIGRQLEDAGVRTALDLKRLDPATAKARWSVVLERTVRELNGLACSDLAPDPLPRQQIACTRSFGQSVTEITDLKEAITEFACHAAEKLRAQGGRAGAVLVFIRTSPFRVQDRQYGRSATVPMRLPSSDSQRIVAAAMTGLERIFRQGFRYAKAGVILVDIHNETAPQQELDLGDEESLRDERQQRLMQTLDALNARYGRGTLRLGTARMSRERNLAIAAASWQMRQERRSPRYTTHWDELMAVH